MQITRNLAEFHSHLGGGVGASVLWELAHRQGTNIGFDSFIDFQKFMTVKEATHESFLREYFPLTEKIQRGPSAVKTCAFHAVAKAYRRNDGRLKHFELRFDPSKRLFETNFGSMLDLIKVGQVIRAAKEGLADASDCYGIDTKLIVCVDRSYTFEKIQFIANEAATQKCDGIDICGIETGETEKPQNISRLEAAFSKARQAGLFLTYHIGESHNSAFGDVLNVIEHLQPQRIGHGLRLLEKLVDEEDHDHNLCFLQASRVWFEICPTVSLITGSVTPHGLKEIISAVMKNGINAVICTDNSYLVNTTLTKELALVDEFVPGCSEYFLDKAEQLTKKYNETPNQ